VTGEEFQSAFRLEPLKHFVSKIGSGKTPSGGATSYLDEGIPFLRSQNVHNDGLRLDDVVYISREVDREMRGTRVRPDDVLLNITGASLGRVAIVPASLSTANVNQHVCIIRCRTALVPGFLWYVLQSQVGGSQIFAEEQGISREGLNFQQVGGLRVPVPSALKLQHLIASFLDRKTAVIDALIAKKERLIELLQEKRQALITEAVTKGLDPNVTMKESGENWLGRIPAHWQALRGKFVLRPYGGYAPEAVEETELDDGIDYYKVDDLNQQTGGFRLERATRKVRRRGIASLAPPAILIPKRGAAIFTNKVRLIPAPCTIDSNVMGLRIVGRHDAEFLALSLFARGLGDVADVSTIPQINNKHIRELVFAVPPPDEQRAIVAEITLLLSLLDRLRGTVAAHIERLQEYRQALITAAVTGKIDVSKEAA
jgi:type I restriction enzyme, S subunit